MNRAQSIQQIIDTPRWDVIIIGGGATGLGCAVDAASRGYKTLLLEKNDFAKGTSSRATKLVHGGVRYLAQGNIRLVREALHERGRLLKNAPHVCHKLPFAVPFYNNRQKWYYRFGLSLYEMLSGKWGLGKTKFLSKKGTLRNLPGLCDDRLTGGILYFDGQFDDSRLAITLAHSATDHGASVINYFSVTGFLKEDGRLIGVKTKDEISGDEYAIRSMAVINATGVFADEVLQMAEGHSEKTIAPSQGIHLVVEKRFFEGSTGLMIPSTDDGRVFFAIPWHDKLLLGTTDTPVEKIVEEPAALKQEIDFVMHHFNRYAVQKIGYDDVLSVFAGLRPLARSGNKNKTAMMPRDHHVEVLPSGLIHVTGGKWTTYRSMAEHAVDKTAAAAGLHPANCVTSELALHGSETFDISSHLMVYGSDAAAIKNIEDSDVSLKQKIHPRYPYTMAEVKWFVQNEMALTVEDVLARRLRLLFLDAKAAMEVAPAVAAFMAKEMNKGEYWIQQQVTLFTTLAEGYLVKNKL